MFDIILLIVLAVLLLLLTFGINIFSNIKSLPTIVLPNSVASIYPSAKATSTVNSSVSKTQTTSYSSTTTTTEKVFKTRRSPLAEQRRRDSTRSFTDVLNMKSTTDGELSEVMKNLFPQGFSSSSPTSSPTRKTADALFDTNEQS